MEVNQIEGLDHEGILAEAHVGDAARNLGAAAKSRTSKAPKPTYFRCPRCGEEIAREGVVQQWNEWSRICWCPSCRTFDPNCHGLPDAPAPENTSANLVTGNKPSLSGG